MKPVAKAALMSALIAGGMPVPMIVAGPLELDERLRKVASRTLGQARTRKRKRERERRSH